MLKLECQNCGTEFEAYPSQIERKFCSHDCYWESKRKRIIRTCETCGKKFESWPSSIKRARGRFCSKKCFYESRHNKVECVCKICGKRFNVVVSHYNNGEGIYCSLKCKNIGLIQQKESVCKYCGKLFSKHASYFKRRAGVFCSSECRDKYQKGKNSPVWKGGISFEPYCTKFNDEFKDRVRSFWDNKCGLCGKTQKDNEIKLSVHHVNYDKMVCCNNTPPLFIPLCKVCHGKTNHNRGYWEHVLTEYVMLHFNGDSYFKEYGVI